MAFSRLNVESGQSTLPVTRGALGELPDAGSGGLIGVAHQFALIVAAALAYFGVRGFTEGSESTAVANGRRLLNVEAVVGIDVEASLQRLILDHEAIVTAANWVYIWGHWPVIGLTLVWLYRRHRDSYTLLRNAMFISGAIGLVIFMLFPVAPPRLMPTGFVDTVTELSTSYRVLQPPSLLNKFAAVPSLHVGWNLLVGILIFRTSGRPAAKLFAVAGPTMMALAVVLTANHYIVDAILGSVVAGTGLMAAVGFAGVKACRQRQRSAMEADRSRPIGHHGPPTATGQTAPPISPGSSPSAASTSSMGTSRSLGPCRSSIAARGS